MKVGAEIGNCGWVRYEFPEKAAIATVLAHEACFAGIGRKTAMKMGQARERESEVLSVVILAQLQDNSA